MRLVLPSIVSSFSPHIHLQPYSAFVFAVCMCTHRTICVCWWSQEQYALYRYTPCTYTRIDWHRDEKQPAPGRLVERGGKREKERERMSWSFATPASYSRVNIGALALNRLYLTFHFFSIITYNLELWLKKEQIIQEETKYSYFFGSYASFVILTIKKTRNEQTFHLFI